MAINLDMRPPCDVLLIWHINEPFDYGPDHRKCRNGVITFTFENENTEPTTRERSEYKAVPCVWQFNVAVFVSNALWFWLVSCLEIKRIIAVELPVEVACLLWMKIPISQCAFSNISAEFIVLCVAHITRGNFLFFFSPITKNCSSSYYTRTHVFSVNFLAR